MLFRKMLRDVWKNKVPFLAIFLMMFAGNFIFSGITSEYNGMRQTFHTFLKETNFADAWVTGAAFGEAEIEKLEQKDGIQKAEGRTVFPAAVQGSADRSLDLYILDREPVVSGMKVVSGDAYSTDRDGIWLDVDFARENGYEIGDAILLIVDGQTVEKEIAGLCYSPEYMYHTESGEMLPDHKSHGFAFVNRKELPDGIPVVYQQILIDGKGDLERAVENALGSTGISILLQKDHPGYSMIDDEIAQHKEIGLLFVAVFVLIAVLITMTTVHRLLYSQRMQIGILKASGFCRRQLYVHYISHSTVVCLAGAVTGWCLGAAVLPRIFYPVMEEVYTLPDLAPAMVDGSWMMPAGCSLVCLMLSAVVCRSYLRDNAAQILYSNFGEKVYGRVALPGLWRHLSFYGQWNLRDIYHNRLRSAMTVFGVVGCVALLFSSMGLYTSMKHLSDWSFDEVQTYGTKVSGTFANEEEKQSLLSGLFGEELMEASVEIEVKEKETGAAFTGLESQDFIRLFDMDKHQVEIKDGVALSQNTAKELGVGTGDRIKWRFSGSDKWYLSVVRAVILTPMTQGITMMREDMEKEGIPFRTTSIIGEPWKGKDLSADNITSVQNREDLVTSLDALMNGSIVLSAVFLIMAVLLGSVILYNLGALSYMERYRNMATLKVLGFGRKQIRRLMVGQNLWLTGAGIGIGLPAGYVLLKVMVGTVQDSIDMSVYAPLPVYGVSLLGTFLLSWIINRMLARKVRSIDMVAALKINE